MLSHPLNICLDRLNRRFRSARRSSQEILILNEKIVQLFQLRFLVERFCARLDDVADLDAVRDVEIVPNGFPVPEKPVPSDVTTI